MSEDELRRQNEEERRKRHELIALLALLYTNMEDEMLRVIADNLGTDDFNGDLDSWRIKHLAAAEAVGRKVSRIAGSYAAAQKQVFQTAINNAASAEVSRVDAALGLSAGASAKTASRAAEYFGKQAKHDINTVNTVMRYKAKQGYVTAVNSAFFNAKQSERIWKALGDNALAVAEGRLSLQSAVRNAIVKMSEKGIPAFIDKAGREWTPEAYVRMDIRTTAANTARRAQWERCKEHNINLIEVSAHAGARPLCAPYQGGIYSLDGSSGTVKDAAGREINFTPLSSTSYGQAAGLFGINCGHQSYPFKPGINFRRYYPLETEEEFAENSKRYAEFQKQRAMERSIRASKRECMMCDAAGDKDGFTKASRKLARRKEAYREYSKSVGLKQHNDRTQVYGFDRSVSGKAVWADRKAGLTNGGNGGIIEQERAKDRMISSSEFAVPKNLTNTRSFRDKFNSMDADPEVQRQYYGAAKEILHHRSGTNGEDLYFYNTKTQKWYKSTSGTKAGTPDYNSEILKGLSESQKGEIVSFHNHPLGMPPSDSDLNAALNNGYAKGYTIGHNGVVFEYTAPKAVIPSGTYEIILAKYKAEGLSDFQAQIKTLDDLKGIYKFEYKEL